MTTRAERPLRNAKRTPVRLAEIAYREIHLSGLTLADQARVGRIWRGLRYLDNDQANLRDKIAGLLFDFAESGGDVFPLVEALKELVRLSPERLAAIDAKERSEEECRRAEAVIRQLSERRDRRSPIERMIDAATGAAKAGAT